jgi:hypothetical protein
MVLCLQLASTLRTTFALYFALALLMKEAALFIQQLTDI